MTDQIEQLNATRKGKDDMINGIAIADEFRAIVEKELEGTEYYSDVRYIQFVRSGYVKIMVAYDGSHINGVQGQHPHAASIGFDPDTLTLEEQHFAGIGGLNVLRATDPDRFPKERYLALGSDRIKFRKPKKDMAAVKRAIAGFVQKWLVIMRDQEERGLLHTK